MDEKEVKGYWEQNKKTIVTTALCAFVALLVIRFFNVILVGGFLVALCVGAVLVWGHYAAKYGGAEGIWKAVNKHINDL